MECGRRKRGRPRKLTCSTDANGVTPNISPTAVLRSEGNTSDPTFDDMDIEPTSSPTMGQLVQPDTNGRKRNTCTRDMAYSPRRRGRPRRSTSVDKPTSSASVTQVISRPDNSISDNGDVEMSYRRRGRPPKVTTPGDSNINPISLRPTLLRCENNARGGVYTFEATHDQSPVDLNMNPSSSNSGDVEMSYRQRGRPRKRTIPGNSQHQPYHSKPNPTKM